MALRIYNTLTKTKEIFEPIQSGRVGIYVCGPTVYDTAHIGHARSAVVFDVLVKFLRSKGLSVTYVRNFTDVDDKIINRANQLGVSPKALAEKYIDEFGSDMESLNVSKPDFEPLATEHIKEIIDFIKNLIFLNHAYVIDGDVYYSVEAFKDYGKLSGRRLEDMEAGSRVDIDTRKRNPFDFSLWKSAKPGEPSWDSPWGKGRPGWHIECSAMSVKYLGESFDIHGGGKDLIFPHHENEIAQSEGSSGKPFVKYWIHNGFVNINQEKMSKSLGNFMTIKDVIKEYHPEVLRLFLISSHYRSPLDFSDKALEEAGTILDRLYGFLDRVKSKINLVFDENKEYGEYWHRFSEDMDDDFNTAKGIGTLLDAIRNLNRLLDEGGNNLSQNTIDIVKASVNDILKITKVLGILSESPEVYFENKKSKLITKDSIDSNLIEKLISDRAQARKDKNWKAADQIRQKLADMNIILEDRPDGKTIWKVKA